MGVRTKIATGLAVLLVAAACTVPPPSVDPTVGVVWDRDAGGTFDAGSSTYTAAWEQYVTMAGVTTGPTPVSPPPGVAIPEPVPPTIPVPVLSFFSPDGTARFPWNGLAGEGISLDYSFPRYSITFPGGTCELLELAMGLTLLGVMPSPDGSKVAFLTRNVDIPGGFESEVRISSLVDGGDCPLVTSARHEFTPGVGGEAANNPALVWRPDSSSIVYAAQKAVPADDMTLYRLGAVPGASAIGIYGAGDGEYLTPLGWSVTDRILLNVRPPGSFAALVSTLETMRAFGGGRRLIDRATLTSNTASLGLGNLSLHYGYFVPGTTTIVFNDGSTRVTNADGYSFPWFQVHVITDVDYGRSGPLTGVAPPLVWHEASLGPGLAVTDVPNVELVERFAR